MMKFCLVVQSCFIHALARGPTEKPHHIPISCAVPEVRETPCMPPPKESSPLLPLRLGLDASLAVRNLHAQLLCLGDDLDALSCGDGVGDPVSC